MTGPKRTDDERELSKRAVAALLKIVELDGNRTVCRIDGTGPAGHEDEHDPRLSHLPRAWHNRNVHNLRRTARSRNPFESGDRPHARTGNVDEVDAASIRRFAWLETDLGRQLNCRAAVGGHLPNRRATGLVGRVEDPAPISRPFRIYLRRSPLCELLDQSAVDRYAIDVRSIADGRIEQDRLTVR